jgi:hypothetical protein
LALPVAARADEYGHAALGGHAAKKGQRQQPRTLPAGHLCEKCAGKLPKAVPADPSGMTPGAVVASTGSLPPGTIVASAGGCAACEAGSAAVYSGADAPGVAYVGGDGPGYAAAGVLATTEPTPVGVMRTDYQGPTAGLGQPMPGVSPYGPIAPNGPQAAPAGMPFGQPPLSGPMSNPGHNRPSVLRHMLGLRAPRTLSSYRQERRRSSHAAIRYEAGPQMLSELPASVVYGPR